MDEALEELQRLKDTGKLNYRKHRHLLHKAELSTLYGVGSEIHSVLLMLKVLYEFLFFQKTVRCKNCEAFSQIINSWPVDYCWEYRNIIIDHIKINSKILGIPFFKPMYTPIILYAVLKVKFLNEYMPISK